MLRSLWHPVISSAAFAHLVPLNHSLIRQLSAVVNFIRFREGKESMFREAMAKKRAIREKARTAQVQ